MVIGPGGVLVIDSKKYWGRLRLDRDGMVWHGHHLLVSALRRVLWAADQADVVLGIADIQVAALVSCALNRSGKSRLGVWREQEGPRLSWC